MGVLLFFGGASARNSINSEISETFAGQPADKAMWLMGSGAALSIIGLAGIARARQQGS